MEIMDAPAVPMTVETLIGLKQFFDSEMEHTLTGIRPSDSDRLLKNKVSGFLLTLQDKLLEMKPKMMCTGCGLVANNGITQMPIRTQREEAKSVMIDEYAAAAPS